MNELQLNRIGILVRDDGRDYPVEHLQRAFAPANAELVYLNENPGKDLDLVFVMGGDGTVLEALCDYASVPVLAVNFGTVGFLTAGDSSELEAIVQRLLEGDYRLERRLMLESTFKGENFNIVNEVVIKGTTKMVSVDVIVDDVFIHTVRGDGVIVGTPTGSTSYLLSTGASIVMPTVDCFILSGINEYRFSSRSLILDGRSTVKIRINESTRERDIFLSHDGRDKHPIELGDELEVRKSGTPIQLIFFEKDYFFRNLKNRLDW